MSWVEPFLKIAITLASLIASGKIPFSNDKLIILHKGNTIRSGINNNSFVGMLEGPLLLLPSRDLIMSINSSFVTNVIRKLKLFRDFRNESGDLLFTGMSLSMLLPTLTKKSFLQLAMPTGSSMIFPFINS